MKPGDRGWGSIYLRASDGRYAADVRSGASKKTLYGRTREEVAAKLAAWHEDQGVPLLHDGNQRLSAFLVSWMTDFKSDDIKPSSAIAYANSIELVIGMIGTIRLSDLHAGHVKSAYTRLRKQGYAPRTIQQCHVVLKMALRDAVAWRTIPELPLAGVSAPSASTHEPTLLSAEDARQLLAVSADDHFYGPLWTVLLTLCLRIGEATALTWDDVDTEAGGTVHVSHTVTRGYDQGLFIGDTKTKGSRRTLSLGRLTAAALKQRSVDHATWQVRTGHRTRLVFPSPVKGAIISNGLILAALRRHCQEAEIPIVTAHELRHSGATILLERGFDARQVQELLGHSTVVTTMSLYYHVREGTSGKIAAFHDDLYGSNRG